MAASMTPPSDLESKLARAAAAIAAADALVITAGAGMGVDSGLPDFRGAEGFWRAYPPYRALGLSFAQMANPATFSRDPRLAWGFYGHRLALYRATRPHAGYELLLEWARSKPAGHGVFTSNVDGHFAAAGFDAAHVVECHGSIHHLQCAGQCHAGSWPAGGVTVSVDPVTMRAADPLPACPRCGGLARPNILMFGDAAWLEDRTGQQHRRYESWLSSLQPVARVTVIECGAGKAIPTVRLQSEAVARRRNATLIRINPTDPDVPPGQLSIPLGAGDALGRIDALMRGAG
jgi:NAD-dependent SIR2 family protein deacetylase